MFLSARISSTTFVITSESVIKLLKHVSERWPILVRSSQANFLAVGEFHRRCELCNIYIYIIDYLRRSVIYHNKKGQPKWCQKRHRCIYLEKRAKYPMRARLEAPNALWTGKQKLCHYIASKIYFTHSPQHIFSIFTGMYPNHFKNRIKKQSKTLFIHAQFILSLHNFTL